MSASSSTMIITSFSDLPKSLQKIALKSQIPEKKFSKNLSTTLNVLKFRNHDYDVYTPEMYEKRSFFRDHHSHKNHSKVSREIISVDSLKREAKVLLENDIGQDNYTGFKEVGKGAYGAVSVAESEVDGFKVAVKVIRHKSRQEKRKNFQEIRFLRYCVGVENILQFVRATEREGELWLVTEYIGGCSLKELQFFYEFGELEIAHIASGTLKALEFLHKNMIAHRDLKNHNIMVTEDGTVKLIDFGLCTDVSQGELIHMVGSPFWMPPEMVRFDFHGLPADIWSFGICIVELANDDHMHGRNYIKTMFLAATEGFPEPFHEPDDWSNTFRNFISKCLQKDPEDRSTVSELQNHRFMRRTPMKKKSFAKIIRLYKEHKEREEESS